MADLIVRRPQQRTLTFDRRERWQTIPEQVQRQCGELVGQLLRAVLQAEASSRSENEREDPFRSS
jgi:DNA mismatch repair protein MutH